MRVDVFCGDVELEGVKVLVVSLQEGRWAGLLCCSRGWGGDSLGHGGGEAGKVVRGGCV